jgi:SAM-dependent methyltransferase
MEYLTLALIILFFFILFNFAWAGFSAAPWVPSKKIDRQRVLSVAQVKPNDIIYDLGCGDGRWLFYFAKNSAAKEIRGFEISLIMFFVAWIKKLFSGYPQVKINLKSLYRANLHQADIVLCFLLPKAMNKLLPKFQKELKSGAKVVSYAFSLPNKTPEIIEKIGQNDISIYRYRF